MGLVRMQNEFLHFPVLLREVLSYLITKGDGVYVDATFGRGGHTKEILNHLSLQGRVIAFDQDQTAIKFGKNKFSQEKRLQLIHGSFTHLEKKILEMGVNQVQGILLDLGVSSPQLEDPARGFSFLREGALDMRMNTTQGETAADWLEKVSEKELADILWKYGEERFSKKIARAIITERMKNPLKTTKQLAGLIASIVPHHIHDRHPATKSFQAIRIYINQELAALENVLPQLLNVLAPGGRFAVISFHSLEDRIVKRFIQVHTRPPILPRHLPVKHTNFSPRLKVIDKAIFPTEEEKKNNPRSRSAVLRIAEKIQ